MGHVPVEYFSQHDAATAIAACAHRREEQNIYPSLRSLIETQRVAGLLTEKQRRAYFLREDFPDMSRQQAASYLKISVRAYSRLCRDAAASIDLLVQMVISAGGDPRKVKDYLRAQIVHNGRSAA